jgi:hypothetical protein
MRLLFTDLETYEPNEELIEEASNRPDTILMGKYLNGTCGHMWIFDGDDGDEDNWNEEICEKAFSVLVSKYDVITIHQVHLLICETLGEKEKAFKSYDEAMQSLQKEFPEWSRMELHLMILEEFPVYKAKKMEVYDVEEYEWCEIWNREKQDWEFTYEARRCFGFCDLQYKHCQECVDKDKAIMDEYELAKSLYPTIIYMDNNDNNNEVKDDNNKNTIGNEDNNKMVINEINNKNNSCNISNKNIIGSYNNISGNNKNKDDDINGDNLMYTKSKVDIMIPDNNNDNCANSNDDVPLGVVVTVADVVLSPQNNINNDKNDDMSKGVVVVQLTEVSSTEYMHINNPFSASVFRKDVIDVVDTFSASNMYPLLQFLKSLYLPPSAPPFPLPPFPSTSLAFYSSPFLPPPVLYPLIFFQYFQLCANHSFPAENFLLPRVQLMLPQNGAA